MNGVAANDAALISRHVVPAGTGYGARVAAGTTFSLVMIDGAQIIDLDLFAAADPTEHYHAATQVAVEGGHVTAGTRIWGSPPQSRPLATVVEDTVQWRDVGRGLRDHKSYGAHCNPHHWILFAGRVPNTCYDNLRAGCAMVGLGQHAIHDNLNLFMKSAMVPETGQHLNVQSDAVDGDRITFLAAIDLLVVLSLCPYGDGSVFPDEWSTTPIPMHPVAFEVQRPAAGAMAAPGS